MIGAMVLLFRGGPAEKYALAFKSIIRRPQLFVACEEALKNKKKEEEKEPPYFFPEKSARKTPAEKDWPRP